MNTKSIVLGLFAIVALIAISASVSAYYPQTPYSGVDTIGTMWRQGGYAPSYGWSNSYYGYAGPARAGGAFGNAFITGLRAPVYAPAPITHYSTYHVASCRYPFCYTGGAGYPRTRASQHPLTTSPGGVFA